MNILAHTSFIGSTGYANHARSFFCALSKYHTVKVRNLTIGKGWKGMSNKPHDAEPYITKEMKDMLILQTLTNSDGTRSDFPMYDYKGDFKPDVHIVLNDTNNPYFFEDYDGYKIAYNVWESTRYPDEFFKRLFYFDQVWVPTQWQFDSLVEQGYPMEKIRIVTEGVDVETFKPNTMNPKSKFKFLLFGRWDYRKSTTEIIKTFGETFKGNDNVELICSVENPYPTDETRSTQDRIVKYGINYPNVKFIDFVSRKDYVDYLQQGDVFVSCSRSEGWNLPLCVPKEKLVFCNNNFVPIEDVKINDNVVTHTSNQQKVIDVFKRKYNGELIKIVLYGDYEALELTPDHPIYAIKRSCFITKKNKHKNIPNITPSWIKAKEIEKGDIVLRTTIPQTIFEDKIFDLVDIDSTLKYDDNYVWYKMGFSQNGILQKYNRYVKLSDMSFLIGWYIAKGCDGESKLIFTLNAQKEIDIAKKLISDVDKIFGSYGNFVIKNNTIKVTFSSKLLCKFFTHICGKKSYNKKIPENVLLGPIEVLEDVIKNMVLGDGCYLQQHRNFYYTTVSEILARQLIFAHQRIGIKSNVQICKRKNRENRNCYNFVWSINNINNRHSNKSWNHPQGRALLVRNVENVKYDGYVFNLEVDKDNSFLLSNATVHNCESMACGTPSIYSDWGGQLQFTKDKGIPVKISHMRKANIGDREVEGEYCEPDFEDLGKQMKKVYENYKTYKMQAVYESKLIHEDFNWDVVAQKASNILEKKVEPFVFVTTGNLGYMPVIEKLVKSINEFSKSKILVYGVDCDVPFESPNMIKRRINPTPYSIYDKWYWKQHACIESLKEDYERFIWIDGDVVVNHNIDTIGQYFQELENYPLSDVHIQEEFLGRYTDENGVEATQLFNERLCNLWDVKFSHPMMHICMYVYNKECKWWFQEILKKYKAVPLEHYPIFYLWNDEGIDNALRWRYGFKKHLPLSNFDTSSYDGDFGNTKQTMNHFYRFWNERGPQNFNRIYGYQFIPEDKSKIIYFHGNKERNLSDQMIEFIKLKRDNSFYQSGYFYYEKYNMENLGEIKGINGGTVEIAKKYGWKRAIYHEIYNLMDYYKDREKRIHDGDVVVDVGANMGIFTRWAYQEGAGKVISFEPDHRYFELLKLNSDPRTILFNAAISDSIGTVTLHEADHFGGSNIFEVPGSKVGYTVRTYTLDYLFESGLVDKIDFLKVDIEGAEIKAFQGISDENLMKVKTIAMEYHHSHLNYDENLRDNFIKRLNLLGFNSYVLYMGTNNALQMIYFSK